MHLYQRESCIIITLMHERVALFVVLLRSLHHHYVGHGCFAWLLLYICTVAMRLAWNLWAWLCVSFSTVTCDVKIAFEGWRIFLYCKVNFTDMVFMKRNRNLLYYRFVICQH
jgi:hypothetical protein